MAELFKSWPAGPVLHTFMQYLIAFCSRQEAANDVISDVFVDQTGTDVLAEFGDSRFNRS